MDDSRRPHPSGQGSEPHLEWCRRAYELADGSTWQDPYDCHDDYAGPRRDDFVYIETLLTEGAPRFLWPHLYRAMVDIAGEDWARHALVWTVRVRDFASRAAFVEGAAYRAGAN